MAYANLPFGLNLVEDPRFERGVGYWRSTGAWLDPGTVFAVYWDNNQSHSGSYSMYVFGATPTAAPAPGGVAYDFDVPLPEGDYLISIWVYPDNGNQTITLRAGRSDATLPGIVGTPISISGLNDPDALVWSQISGTFHSDGIHPTSILVRNEVTGSGGYFHMDDVAVVPTTSAFADDIYAQMAPVADQDVANGSALKRYLRAGALMFDQVNGYIRDLPDGTPGWAVLANPMAAPAETLDWLSQISGTKLDVGMKTPDKRLRIKNAPARSRGTRNAIIAAVQNLLTAGSDKFVAVHEYDPDKDHFGVGVLKSEISPFEYYSNLMPDGSFELGTINGFTNSGGFGQTTGATITANNSDGTAYDGFATMKVVTTANNQGAHLSLDTILAGKNGWKVYWQVAIRGAVGGEKVRIYAPGNLFFGVQVTLTTSWQVFSGISTVNVPGSEMNFYTDASAPATFYVDGVMIGGASSSLPAGTPFIPNGGNTTVVRNAVESQRPVELIQNAPVYLDGEWTYWTIGSSIQATQDVNSNVIYQPGFKSYADLRDHFTGYDDLKAQRYHSYVNIFKTLGVDPGFEKTDTLGLLGWYTAFGTYWKNSGGNLVSGSSVFAASSTPANIHDSNGLECQTTAANQGTMFDLGVLAAGTYSVNLFAKASAASSNLEFWCGPSGSLVRIANWAQGTAILQQQGTFVADGTSNCYFIVRCTDATAKTWAIDDVVVAEGSIVFGTTI
jgi:hypothetical protein